MLYKLLNITEQQYSDLVNWIDESCIDEDDFVEFVQEETERLEKCIWEINLFILFLEYISIKADVEELIETISEDEDNTTFFDVDPDKAIKLLVQVPEDERSPAWFFLLDFLNIDLSEEDIN